MKQITCITAILFLSVCLIPGAFAQTLMSDEFTGTGQDLQSFWQVKDSDKSPWELKDGLLVAEQASTRICGRRYHHTFLSSHRHGSV